MRIVQLLPDMDKGETAGTVLDFATELVRQGHESTVISADGALVSRLTLHGSEHISMPVHKASWRRPGMAGRLRRLLRRLGADVLHAYGPRASWLAWRAWRGMPERARPKLVTALHEWPQPRLIRGRIVNRALARGELVVTPSEQLSGALHQRYSSVLSAVPPVVYRGVNTREMDRDAPVSGHWHQRLLNQYPQLEGRHWLLLPAPVGPGCGQEAFLQLLKQLSLEREDIFGLIVGEVQSGQEKFARSLERRAADIGLSDKVLFLGNRRDMREFYATARITYQFSEGASGRAVAQALAMGCPVITCSNGVGREMTQRCFPQGVCVELDLAKIQAVTLDILANAEPVRFDGFSLEETTGQMLALYAGESAVPA
ncbi:glycosyltransferase [Microbulbifer sp.]|uniref:glycosyltransferase n=1 Tax=Microbulbifer sp. TaxID=1908541 RepID=UPI0025893FA5|nr:glycosyltransferase [Microbulbifer sp.]